MQTCYITYAGIPIEYQLTKKPIKNINIRITRTGEIHVSAPQQLSLTTVASFVAQKGDWIIHRLADQEKQAVSNDPHIYSGKTVYYLGNPYQLQIQKQTPPRKTALYFSKNIMILTVPNPAEEESVKKYYLAHLNKKARVLFHSILSDLYPIVEPLGIQKPAIAVRNMKTIWGSCHTACQKITLNLQLIKTPRPCIEQVLLHELVHFLHPNHSPAFYQTLTSLMPDWKERKSQLKTQYRDGL